MGLVSRCDDCPARGVTIREMFMCFVLLGDSLFELFISEIFSIMVELVKQVDIFMDFE